MSTDEISTSYQQLLYQDLQDPVFMQQYLQASFQEALADGNFKAFLLAIQNAVDASKLKKVSIARQTGFSRQHLYKVLNGDSMPAFDKVVGLLQSLGIKIDFRVAKQKT